MREFKNILSNATRLGATGELVRKAVGKCLEPSGSPQELMDWCKSNATNIQEWIPEEKSSLWEEADQFARRLRKSAKEELEILGVTLGGGGHYGLLYFLTRSLEPSVVVETGVAAGFSSKAILTAMKENGKGELYSSDFPYCRLDEPEKYIGVLVPPELRDRWSLFIKGDRKNLPLIASKLEPNSVELFHYDSDKSGSGREFAFRTISKYLAPNSVCIFDDIQNNWHFKNLIESIDCNWKVFEFGGKYLGLVEKARLT